MQQDQQTEVAPSKTVRGKTTVGGERKRIGHKDMIGDPTQDLHCC